MRLTPPERAEILRYIDKGKPLPDKYRFRLFDEARQVELTWNGKTDSVCDVVLPFQTIEQVDEPRSEKQTSSQFGMHDLQTGRQLAGWHNKLIWGDNSLILSSLLRGPLRKQIEAQGGLKLIYIDPPFDVGADFSMDIQIGEETLEKEPNILEENTCHTTKSGLMAHASNAKATNAQTLTSSSSAQTYTPSPTSKTPSPKAT